MRNILKTADCRAKQIKFGTHGPMYCICRVLFISDSLSLVRGNSQNCKISDVKIFKKATGPPVFIQFQPNYIISMLVMRKYRLLLFGDLAKLKKLWHFEIFVNRIIHVYGAGNFKTLLCSFHLISAIEDS